MTTKQMFFASFNWRWKLCKENEWGGGKKEKDDLLGDRHRLEGGILLWASHWKGRKGEDQSI